MCEGAREAGGEGKGRGEVGTRGVVLGGGGGTEGGLCWWEGAELGGDGVGGWGTPRGGAGGVAEAGGVEGERGERDELVGGRRGGGVKRCGKGRGGVWWVSLSFIGLGAHSVCSKSPLNLIIRARSISQAKFAVSNVLR